MTDTTERNDSQDLPADSQDLPSIAASENVVEAAEWICPEFALARIFSSHMVLQRDKEIVVWGFSRQRGSTVHGTLDRETAAAVVDESGKWRLTFSARPASFVPITLSVTDGSHTCTLDDILIGDVWLIGGQSNSELLLSRCMEETPDLAFSEENGVRLFSQYSYLPKQNKALCVAPQLDLVSEEWHWQCASREASLRHSALGWYLAHELIDVTGVPQGTIMMCAGGASIFDLAPAEFAHVRGVFQGGMTCEGGLYNTLIHPLLGLSFAGQVFFQGESEGCSPSRSDQYDRLLADFVADERARFGFDFPFYNVQLSSYRDAGAQFFKYLHVVRMRQYDALKCIPHYTLTPDFDLGALPKYEDWAHSTLKAELARRLAMVILAEYYGIGDRDTAHAPMPAAVTTTEDGTAYKVIFRGVGDGLLTYGRGVQESLGTAVTGFFTYDGKEYTPAAACLTASDTVTITTREGATHVAYAFIPTVTPENANLYRAADMVPPPAFTEKIIK